MIPTEAAPPLVSSIHIYHKNQKLSRPCSTCQGFPVFHGCRPMSKLKPRSALALRALKPSTTNRYPKARIRFIATLRITLNPGPISRPCSRSSEKSTSRTQNSLFSISQYLRKALRAFLGLRSLTAPPATHKNSCSSHAPSSFTLVTLHLLLRITPQNLSPGQPYSRSRYSPSSELSKNQISLSSTLPWPRLNSLKSGGRSNTPLPQSQNFTASSISG
jgi:hypothetical protein